MNNLSAARMVEKSADPLTFDPSSGNFLERLIFKNRALMVAACILVTIFLALQIRGVQVSASFEKMLPQSHEFIMNYLENRDELRGLGDSVRVVVETKGTDIFDPEYLEVLAGINDEIFLLPGVDRAWQKSLFTPVVRWTEVTEEGFVGGTVMPSAWDGSERSIEELRLNIARAGVVGTLVGFDYKSSMIVVPLLARDAEGRMTDYHGLATALEKIREKYSAEVSPTGQPKVEIHIIGFAKLAGDLIDGLEKVMAFFLVAACIAVAIIFRFTRCIRSTLLVLGCSLIALVWLRGLLTILGYGLDPFSILVPFLVFAIGVSHGAQKMNGIMQDVGRGAHKLVAARLTFRRLFMAGATALFADVVGFAVLMIIDVPVIRELALAASLGVAILVFTNLILLPILLSYTGVGKKAAMRSLRKDEEEGTGGLGQVWSFLDRFTERRWATGALIVSALMAIGGYMVSMDLKIGDLDPGAPELRSDSRYNLDNAYITSHYGVSSDVFAVMVKTEPEQSCSYETLTEVDRLAWTLAQLPGVQRTASLADTVRQYNSGSFEGNPKWLTIPDNQALIDPVVTNAINWYSEYLNSDCSLIPVLAFLEDHKAETLDAVVSAASDFARTHDTDQRKFLLAAGSSGIEAATNIVVGESNRPMLLYVYAAVSVLCFIAFRSWRAVVVAVLPLMLTSILAEALMVWLGIGVKVATLPVIALGVGIGVDYALYLLSVQLAAQRGGLALGPAYKQAVAFTGKIVALVGVTLAAGVVTWAWSPIKFQADMGILLTFMFVWNMLGALVLIPALSHFLLPTRAARTFES